MIDAFASVRIRRRGSRRKWKKARDEHDPIPLA
jgi:hypothetical protein